MRLRSGLGCNAGARRGSAGSSSLVADLPGTLVRKCDPALYDQPIGVERVDFDVGEPVPATRSSNSERSLPRRIKLRCHASFANRVDANPLAPLLDLPLHREADLLGHASGSEVSRIYEGDKALVAERVEAVISCRPGRLCRETSAPEPPQEEVADLDLIFAFYLLHGEAALSSELARVFEDCHPEAEGVISIALLHPAHPLLRLLAALGVRIEAHRHRVGEDAHKGDVDVASLHLAEHHPLRLENFIRY